VAPRGNGDDTALPFGIRFSFLAADVLLIVFVDAISSTSGRLDVSVPRSERASI
jgi:hypothetical protein